MSSPASEVIHNAIRRCLARQCIKSTEVLVVACSAGADSSALATALGDLSILDEVGPLVLTYVDHQLRLDTGRDAEVVSQLASSSGADFRLKKVVVDRGQASLERAAREARYRALEEVATEVGGRFILTAHTASDQAETVLMRIIRGTGVIGLGGIPERRGRLVRPLLSITRAEIDSMIAERGIETVPDPSNEDLGFTRNRIRHHWLAALGEENPTISSALCRIASAAREQAEVLDYAASALIAVAREGKEPNTLRIAPLAAAPKAVSKRAFARVALDCGISLESTHLNALLELVQRPTAGSVNLDVPSLTISRVYDDLIFRVGRSAKTEFDITGPNPPYVVRYWQNGDRMRPARLKGRSKKLSDLYGEMKVPRSSRPHARVVVGSDGVIEWAEHVGSAWQSGVEVAITAAT